VTITGLANEIGRSRQWLNKLVDQGKIPGVKRGNNGRLIIHSEGELNAWLESPRVREIFRPIRRSRQDSEFLSYGRTALLIHALFGLERVEENYPSVFNACWKLPAGEGLNALHGDSEFTKFKNYPVFEWVCTARTEKARALREDVALHSYRPGEFRSMADIARKHDVTRAAVSKAYRQMMELEPVPSNSRGRWEKSRRAKAS
jgi:hypothetical protein